MKVRVFAAMHGRHEVFNIFKAGFDRLSKKYGCDLFMVCSTPNDANVLRLLDIPYAVEQNMPLSNKHNSGVRAALADKEWTHLLIMGSDDVLTDEGYEILTRLNVRHAGFYGGLYYDTLSGRCKHYDFPRDLKMRRLFGAGRLLTRELVEYVFNRDEMECIMPDLGCRRGEKIIVPRLESQYLCASKRWKLTGVVEDGLWPNELFKGLDMNLEANLVSYGAAPVGISGVHLCDFKSMSNLWHYDDREGVNYSFEDFASRLSNTENDLINKITKKAK